MALMGAVQWVARLWLWRLVAEKSGNLGKWAVWDQIVADVGAGSGISKKISKFVEICRNSPETPKMPPAVSPPVSPLVSPPASPW